jgi:hypothetical protein
MKHLIQRAGQQYGPYSLNEIRHYVQEGNILTTDLAREESSAAAWIPVTDVLGANDRPPDQPMNSPVLPFNPVTPDMYYVLRQGQQFGPYSLDEVRIYLAQGSLVPTDAARKGEQGDWTTVQMVTTGPRGAGSPAPPSLHWAILLLLCAVTWGFFLGVWIFVQSAWVKKINPQSKATRYYAISLVLAAVAAALSMLYLAALNTVADDLPGLTPSETATWSLSILVLSAVSGGFMLAGFFSIKKSIETYFTKQEPMGLRLSGILTFFFHLLYLQYHFRRIAQWKRTGVLPA